MHLYHVPIRALVLLICIFTTYLWKPQCLLDGHFMISTASHLFTHQNSGTKCGLQCLTATSSTLSCRCVITSDTITSTLTALLPYLAACVAGWELHATEGGGPGAAAQVYQSVLRALSEGPFAGPCVAEECLWLDYAATMADCCWVEGVARPAHVHAALSQVGIVCGGCCW